MATIIGKTWSAPARALHLPVLDVLLVLLRYLMGVSFCRCRSAAAGARAGGGSSSSCSTGLVILRATSQSGMEVRQACHARSSSSPIEGPLT